MTDVDVDSMLSNFDALLAKYQTTASPDLKTTEAVDKITWPADRKADKPMEVVYQQDRPASPPPVFDVPSSPRADTPPQLRPPPRQPPAPTPARGDSEVADAYDEDFDEDFEEDIGGDDDAPAAPAKPATPELPKPAARAGRRAGAPAALSPGVTPPGEIGFGGKRLVEEFGGKRVPKPVGNGWAERSGLQEQERQRQERMLADARSEAVRLERLEAQMREEEEERRREDEEVERRIAAARRRKEEAALRQRDADADREAMAGGSFLTSVDLPDISSARPVVNPPLAKGPKQRSKPPPARASREPPAKPPVPVAESSVVDEIVKERKRMADLARENAQLGAELSKVQREVERVRKEAQVLQGKAGPPRSAGAMRPASKQGGRGGRRPPSTADAERELRLAQNARRQLEYYAKEHEQLRRQVSKLASAEGEMQSLSAVAAARVEALAAAAKRGKELARAQKEVQKALGAPQREDPGRALVLLREEVRVLRERHGKVRGQAEAQEKDVTNHQARMAEVQAEVDDYTRRLAELQGQIRLRQEAVDRETAGGEAGLKLRDLERQVAEEDGAAARERAEQRVKMNDLVGEIKRERGRVEAAARIARNVEEELRELELKKKQRERARRDARTAGRAAAEAERAEAEAADAHAVSLLRAAALSPKKRTPAAKPARASVSVKSLKGEEAAAETLSGAVVEPGETASSDRSASRLSGRVEAAGSSRGGEGAQAPSSRLGSRGGGDDGSDGGLDLPELDEEEVKPQREHEHLRGDFARTSSRGEDQDHAAGVTYTTALDDFDEESDREEDVL